MVKRGASESIRPCRDSRIAAQFARQPHLCVLSDACIGRSVGHKTIACIVCGDGCVEVIRGSACEVRTALTNCVGGRIEPIELRRGETSESDRMRLPKIVTALGAGIHKSRVACVQQLAARSRLMRTRGNRIGRYSNTDRSGEAYTSSTRVRYGVFAK